MVTGRATALVAGAVMAGSLFAAAPAFASTAAAAQCPANRFCAWTDPGHTGTSATFATGAFELGGQADNNIESVRNRTSSRWCLYDLRGFRGLLDVVEAGEEGDLPAPARNKVSSLRVC
ncbi:hypothetical protein GCM10022267_53990 [Lentzea roselyniae]|uniref:Peptidase inhibitor family I36 n=1 Tax=Lentzea roselyniae TaxID=531940 RepID=A0ABP7BJH4_9PSEU